MIDINMLLALPERERLEIAEKLWESLFPTSVVLREDETTTSLLEDRWRNIQSGKSIQYSPSELKSMIAAYRNGK